MKVLVIAAHPDDEVLGVGGTMAYHVANGDEVYVLMVTEGASTQYEGQPEKIDQKKKELNDVKEILGITKVIYLNFPDMKLDTISKVTLNQKLTEVIYSLKPEVVYTHFFGDINSDHKAVFDATMVAVRPIRGNSVRKVLCYYVPSSTEWAAQTVEHAFLPNVYMNITDQLSKKLKAMEQYQSELCQYPHPRSLKAITNIAHFWGQHIEVEAAEPFMLIREIYK